MKHLPVQKLLLLVLGALIISVVLSTISFYPTSYHGKRETSAIIDDSFNLSSREIYRQGLGSFHGDENITIIIAESEGPPVNFTLLTYNGQHFSTVKAFVNYSFPAGADYYEATFQSNTSSSVHVHFQVFVQKPFVEYSFSWLSFPAKVLFVVSWGTAIVLTLWPMKAKDNLNMHIAPLVKGDLEKKNLRRLKIGVVLSLMFWVGLLILNSYPMATFENWYTDAARHPYTSSLFTKVGLSIFDTPLGKLSTADSSFYKFVSWAEMPHLYPIGSIFLFMPFGAMLQAGISQALVFKLEIVAFLIVSHICLYLFLKKFWKQELNLTPREVWYRPFWRQEFNFFLKAFGTYLLYILLVVYSANGQFDAVAFLFLIVGIGLFVSDRQDFFLLLVAVACSIKYQAGIFLFPLVLLSVIQLFQTRKVQHVLKNKAILAALALVSVNVFTAFLGAPFLLTVKPEFVMNGVNAFSPHAQISWATQAFTVFLTLGVTLACVIYLFSQGRVISLFMMFSLLPIFSMPYFQPWYLPFFFIYPLISQSKRSLRITLIWLIFISFVLSFGGLSYNPLSILDNIRRILKF